MSAEFRELFFGLKEMSDVESLEDLINDLEVQELKKIVAEAVAHQNDDEPAPEYENLGWSTPLIFNIDSHSIECLDVFLGKVRDAELSSEELEYVTDRIDFTWDVSVFGDGSWVPQISVAGNFIVRNLHRVIGLTDVKTILSEERSSELLSKLPGLFEDQAEDGFGFVVNHEEDGITLYKTRFPAELNKFGQAVVCLSPNMLEQLHPEFNELDFEPGRSGCVYLRNFSGQVAVYVDGRLDDCLDSQFFNSSIGFYEESEEGDKVIMIPDVELSSTIYELIRDNELSYLKNWNLDSSGEFVDYKFVDSLSDALNYKLEQFTKSYASKMRYSLEPVFSSNPNEVARYQTFRDELAGVGILDDNNSAVVRFHSESLAQALIDGYAFEFIEQRVETILNALEMDFAPTTLKDYLSEIEIHLQVEDAYRKLGTVKQKAKIKKTLETFLKKCDKSEEYDVDDEEERLSAISDVFGISLVFRCIKPLPVGAYFSIAKYLSQDNARAVFISSRFPVYQSYSEGEEDSGSHTSYNEGSEYCVLHSLESDDDSDWDEDDEDFDDEESED